MPGAYNRGYCRRFSAGILLAVALVPAAQSLQAAPGRTGPVTLDGAAREAVTWHPSVVEAIGRLNARGEEIRVAQAGYYPQIRAGLGSSYDNSIRSRWRPRTDISASQMIYDFGKVASSVDAARAGTRIGRAQLLLSVDTLIRDTTYAAIEVQRGAALHHVALDQLASIKSIGDLVYNRYTSGAATKSDALQAQARVEAAEAILSEIASQQQRWKSNLAHLLGRETVTEVSADVPSWLANACAPRPTNWDEVPAIMLANAERDQARADLRRSRAEGLPTISVGAGTATDVTDPFSSRSDYSFGVNVSSNLYSGGAVRARARGAAFALGAADAAEAAARNETSLRLAEAQQQIGNLTELLDTLVSRQGNMAETGKLYRMQYLEMGTRTLVDLLNAEQELHQVRFDTVNTMHDLRRLQTDCLYNSGTAREAFGLSGTTVQGVTL